METNVWSMTKTDDSIIINEIVDGKETPIAVLPKTNQSILMSYAEMMYRFIKKLHNDYPEFLSESQDGQEIELYVEEILKDIEQDELKG